MSISSPWYQSSRSTLNTLRTAPTAASAAVHAAGASGSRASVSGSGDSAGIAVASSLWIPRPVPMPVSTRTPMLQHVPQRLLERDRGLPTGGSDELRVVAEEDLHVRGAHARRVLFHLDLHFRQGEEHVEGLTDGPAAAPAQIVDFSGLALLEREHVTAHHVAYVCEVALRLEVADAEHRRLPALLDVGDLLGEVAGDEHGPATWPFMIEAPRAHAVHFPAHPILVAQHVLRHLADRVRRERPQR